MPKPTKLHSKPKGKPTSLQKPLTVSKDSSESGDIEESVSQFQLELCWCIQHLERTLSDKKVNEKQLQETWKVLTVLKNNNQPMIRKRQLMRTHFGDYRAKMAAEEKKLAKMASKMKITDSPVQPKATFLRKSAFLSTGDNSFRFAFNLTSEQEDDGNPGNSNEAPVGNTQHESSSAKTNVKNSSDANIQTNSTDNSKFKFKFSQSEFKFNFDVVKD